MLSEARFRNYLLHKNYVNEEQLQAALLELEKNPWKKLGQVLCDKGFLEERDLLKILHEKTQIPPFPGLTFIHLDSIKKFLASPHPQSIPFLLNDDGLHVAMLDAENLLLRDQLQHQWGHKIIAYHITRSLFDELYESTSSYTVSHDQDYRHSRINTSKASFTTLLTDLLMHALRTEASDIHFQPTQTHLIIRLRIDGMLTTLREMHLDQWPQLRTQLKVLARMDVAEERRPHHGRFQNYFAGRMVDFRVSSHPTIDGENIVVRLLDKKKSLMSLDELGFSKDHKKHLRECIRYNHGLILFTGPTGSGKTTSLYALLSEMDHSTRHIVTLEQPVEYAIPGIRQSEITQNMSFAEGVRSLLRQDPDVILIGEIRDEETAQMALRASMTGHLVLSTLHTHDVLSAPHRLINLGISEDLLASHLLCIVSQRLLRKICFECHKKSPQYECTACHNKRFKGRTIVGECLFINDAIRQIIAQKKSMNEIKKHHQHSLWDDALEKINQGVTTLEETIRILGPKPF